MSLAATSLIVSVFALLISALAAFYTWRQANLAEKQQEREEAVREWAEKFGQAVKLVLQIHPLWIQIPPALNQVNAYGLVFPDLELRSRIDLYLISRPPGAAHPEARVPTREQLCTSEVRRTISDVLDRVEEFRRTNSDVARRVGIL
jgi:hypothetical protein